VGCFISGGVVYGVERNRERRKAGKCPAKISLNFWTQPIWKRDPGLLEA
jgi:hypothetical protein